jgi:hypothetical protein
MANFLGLPTFAMNLLHSRGGEGLGAAAGGLSKKAVNVMI